MPSFRAITNVINDQFKNFSIVNIYTNECVFDLNLMQNKQGLKMGTHIPIVFTDIIVVENDCGEEYVTYDDLNITVIVKSGYVEFKVEFAPEQFEYLFIPK